MKIIDEENVLQQELNRFQDETKKNNFVLNKKKTFIMSFNFSRGYAFPPDFMLKKKYLK